MPSHETPPTDRGDSPGDGPGNRRGNSRGNGRDDSREDTRRVAPGVVAALAVTAVLVVVGVVALVLGLRGTPGPPQPAAARAPSASTSAPLGTIPPAASPGQGGTPPAGMPATTDPENPRTEKPSSEKPSTEKPSTESPGSESGPLGRFLEASQPTSLEIPSIGVRSSHFVPLTIQRDGTISVPGTAQEVGLYADGPTPGQLGPSVLAAHVDTPSGVPGIFHDLGKVEVGDVVTMSRQDGSRLTFSVDRVAAYEKAQFPTELVYKGDFSSSEIRLVTCGGPTDDRNEYRDNVVVFGHLTSAR